jgi:hypothetical protein
MLTLAGAVGKMRSFRWGRLWRALQPYGPFALFSTAQWLGTVLVYHGDLGLKPWYYMAQPWLTVLLAGLLFNRLSQSRLSRAMNYPSNPHPLASSPSESASRRERGDFKGADNRPADRKARIRNARSGSHRRGALWLPGALLLLIWGSIPLTTLFSIRQRVERARLIRDPLYDAALWVRDHLPPDAVIGSWNAGTIGYFSGRRVINLDGLVNSWDYWQTGRFDLCRYWQQNRITYLVDAFENGHALSRVPTYSTYAPCADRLQRIWSADGYGASWRMEVYRFPLRDERK